MRFCDDLSKLMQDEKSAISRFLAGDVCEEYKKLLDLEMEELMRLKRIMGSN